MVKKLFNRVFLILLFSVSAVSLNTAAANAESAVRDDGTMMVLFGIGNYEQLRRDVFVGAIYAPSNITTVPQLMDNQTDKRLTVRMIAERFSGKQMGRFWKERIAINNPRTSWQPLARDIMKFSKLLDANYTTGDEIILDYYPDKGTQIIVDGVTFGNIESPEFFNLLINAWVGDIPPSKAFKQGLLNELSSAEAAQIKARFNALTPVQGRIARQVMTSPATPAAEVASKESASGSQDASAKKEESARQETAKKETPKKETAAPTEVAKADEPKKDAGQRVADQEGERKDSAKKDSSGQVAQGSITTRQPEKTITKKDQDTAKAERPVSIAELPVVVEAEPAIDEDLIRGSYQRELIDAIRAKQEYPVKAYRQGLQGEGIFLVVVDREGSIDEIELIESTGERLLDRETMRMIKRAGPLPGIPRDLSEDTFKLEVPIVYSLN